MLKNMFIGRPAGNYDHLLDFSFPKTGNLFFVPSATFLENVADDAASVRTAPPGGTSERAFTAESIDLIERLDRKMDGIAHEGCGRLRLIPQAISP